MIVKILIAMILLMLLAAYLLCGSSTPTISEHFMDH